MPPLAAADAMPAATPLEVSIEVDAPTPGEPRLFKSNPVRSKPVNGQLTSVYSGSVGAGVTRREEGRERGATAS